MLNVYELTVNMAESVPLMRRNQIIPADLLNEYGSIAINKIHPDSTVFKLIYVNL